MKNFSIDEFISSSISANQEIFNLIQTYHDELKQPLQKGFGGDISIGIDIQAEEIFVKHLGKYGKIISEESGEIGEGEFTIMIDPLDGSDNFKSNIPYFGSSLSISYHDRVLVGIITNFANEDIFIKTKRFFKRGKLFLDEFKKVGKNSFSSVGIFERAYQTTLFSKRLREKEIKYRNLGAMALSLAYAHEVEFVIFNGKPREFDVSAGRFMCEELYLYEDDTIFLVSKDEEIFKKLRELV